MCVQRKGGAWNAQFSGGGGRDTAVWVRENGKSTV